MTDRINTRTGTLTIQNFTGDPDESMVIISKTRPKTAALPLIVPIAELLAVIDFSAPDAMRSYLRERSDYLDSPHDLDTIPEADSPEDIDEHHDTPDGEHQHDEADPIERRLYVIDRLARSLRAGTDAELVTALADWVLDR